MPDCDWLKKKKKVIDGLKSDKKIIIIYRINNCSKKTKSCSLVCSNKITLNKESCVAI